MMVLDEKLREHQSGDDSSCVEHEYLYKIPGKSI